MRILFANATRDWGGEKSWALETAVCLQGSGHVCMMVGRRGDIWLAECQRIGLESYVLRFGPGIFNPLGIYNLQRVARRRRPDCLVVNISRDLCAGVAVGALLGLPVIRHVGLAGDLNHDPIDWFLHTRCLAGTIAVGHQMKREMLGQYPWLPASQVEVIHIGKDTRVFRPAPGDELRRAWGLSDDELIVGVTSQLEKKKGHCVLFDALSRPGLGRAHVAVVGTGEYRDALQDCVDRRGLRERVHFLGFSRELPRLLRNFDVFALPSLCEGFPNTLVEAMATGLPCVATDLACIPEILEHGRNGLLVKAGDAEALACALESLLGDPGLRRSLGEAARESVVERFDLDAATHRLASYLSSIVAAHGRGSAPRSGP